MLQINDWISCRSNCPIPQQQWWLCWPQHGSRT